jgi:hypothetical protein
VMPTGPSVSAEAIEVITGVVQALAATSSK